MWLHRSVGRASHRYRGGHGFESRWSPDLFRLLLSNCLNWKINYDDHSSLSSTTAVQIWIISYKFHMLLYGKVVLVNPSFLIGSFLDNHLFWDFCQIPKMLMNRPKRPFQGPPRWNLQVQWQRSALSMQYYMNIADQKNQRLFVVYFVKLHLTHQILR